MVDPIYSTIIDDCLTFDTENGSDLIRIRKARLISKHYSSSKPLVLHLYTDINRRAHTDSIC